MHMHHTDGVTFPEAELFAVFADLEMHGVSADELPGWRHRRLAAILLTTDHARLVIEPVHPELQLVTRFSVGESAYGGYGRPPWMDAIRRCEGNIEEDDIRIAQGVSIAGLSRRQPEFEAGAMYATLPVIGIRYLDA